MNAAEKAAFEDPRVMAEEDAGVKRALAAVVELEQKRDGMQARLQEIKAERDEYAFEGALSRGASPSRRALERLQAEAAATESELGIIEAGLKTAHLRVSAARERSVRSTAETDARHVLELCEQLRAEGTACGDALASFGIHYAAFEKTIGELCRLGYGPSNARLSKLAAERAIASTLSPLRLSPTPALSPGQRTSMPAIAESYAQSAEGAARRVINNGEAA